MKDRVSNPFLGKENAPYLRLFCRTPSQVRDMPVTHSQIRATLFSTLTYRLVFKGGSQGLKSRGDSLTRSTPTMK